MTLAEIEKEVRKDFTFNKSEQPDREDSMPNEWRINKTQNCRNESAAIIVFIGIAYLYGFETKEVINHLSLDIKRYTYYVNKFKQALHENDLGQYHPLLKTDVNEYIIAKTQMILNYLKLIDKNQIISLADFQY